MRADRPAGITNVIAVQMRKQERVNGWDDIPTSQITRRRSLKDVSFSPASVQFKGLIAPHGAA
jgi:hypothetical protein